MQFDETLLVIDVVNDVLHLLDDVAHVFYFHLSDVVIYLLSEYSLFATAEGAEVSVDVVEEDPHFDRDDAILNLSYIAFLIRCLLCFKLILMITKDRDLMPFEQERPREEQDDDHQALCETTLLLHDVDQSIVLAVVERCFVVQQDVEVDYKVISVAVVVVRH